MPKLKSRSLPVKTAWKIQAGPTLMLAISVSTLALASVAIAIGLSYFSQPLLAVASYPSESGDGNCYNFSDTRAYGYAKDGTPGACFPDSQNQSYCFTGTFKNCNDVVNAHYAYAKAAPHYFCSYKSCPAAPSDMISWCTGTKSCKTGTLVDCMNANNYDSSKCHNGLAMCLIAAPIECGPKISVSLSGPTPTPSCANATLSFQAYAVGSAGPWTFSWGFGDGATASNQGAKASHTYKQAGIPYTVRVTAYDGASKLSTYAETTFTIPGCTDISISGNVYQNVGTYDFAGSPLNAQQAISDAEVTIVKLPTSGGTVSNPPLQRTNSQGLFQFYNLTAGNYGISIKKYGYILYCGKISAPSKDNKLYLYPIVQPHNTATSSYDCAGPRPPLSADMQSGISCFMNGVSQKLSGVTLQFNSFGRCGEINSCHSMNPAYAADFTPIKNGSQDFNSSDLATIKSIATADCGLKILDEANHLHLAACDCTAGRINPAACAAKQDSCKF